MFVNTPQNWLQIVPISWLVVSSQVGALFFREKKGKNKKTRGSLDPVKFLLLPNAVQFAFNDVVGCETSFKEKSSEHQRNWILEKFREHSKAPMEIATFFVIKGRTICKEAWSSIHDIKKDRMRRIENDFRMGTRHYVHGNTGIRHVSLKTANCISWLHFFVKAVGDFQPDQKGIHLPSCYNVRSIYKEMEKEFSTRGEKPVSLSQFYEIWRSHFSEVKIPKVCSSNHHKRLFFGIRHS